MSYIYPEMLPDYYPSFTEFEFKQQLDTLTAPNNFVAATDNGFKKLNVIEKIMEMIKGLLGGTNHSESHRVQAAILKFLYYGEAHGFLTSQRFTRLKDHLKYPSANTHPLITKLFLEMDSYRANPTSELRPKYLHNIRAILIDYHYENEESYLRPSFWYRIFHSPTIERGKIFHFGNTLLQLSQQALQKEEPNPHLAFSYLQKAFDIKNDEIEFQESLVQQLQTLENNHSLFQNQKQQFQELWIQLAQVSYTNKQLDKINCYLSRALEIDPFNLKMYLQIGKLYLTSKQYKLALPFLSDLQKVYSYDIQLLTQIGEAYWQEKQFTNALCTYESTLKFCQEQDKELSNYQKLIAFLNYRIGMICVKNKIPNLKVNRYTKALPFFLAAVHLAPTIRRYQNPLCYTYVQLWKKMSPDTFIENFDKDFLNFLKIFDPSLLKKGNHSLSKVVLGCIKHHFQNYQPEKAYLYTEKALSIFDEEVDVKIEILDLMIQHHSTFLKSRFSSWLKKHHAHPHLKEKIGDAYSDSDKKAALALYLEALDLFHKRIAVAESDEERKDCFKHIARIKAKMGQFQLQSQGGIDYDIAIEYLEHAVYLDPSQHSVKLFDVCLKAGEAELKKSWFTRDKEKIKYYYQTAFNAMHQEGSYLAVLMELYLENEAGKAILLYYDIQKEPWREQFVLPIAVFLRLTKELLNKKDYEGSLRCYKKIYELKPQDKEYKKSYLEAVKAFAHDKIEKIALEELKEEDVKYLSQMIQELTACRQKELLTDTMDKSLEPVKRDLEKMLTKIHHSLAKYYVQLCQFPKSMEEYDYSEKQDHLEKHAQNILSAKKHYALALKYDPKSAVLYFDKGVLLNWTIDSEKALYAFEQAVELEPYNPFYHKMLGSLSNVVHVNSEKQKHHNELASQLVPEENFPTFEADYQLWEKEYMSMVKTKAINPHAYTQQKQQKQGWFGL